MERQNNGKQEIKKQRGYNKSNILILGIQGEENKNKAETIFREIMSENFTKMLKILSHRFKKFHILKPSTLKNICNVYTYMYIHYFHIYIHFSKILQKTQMNK